MWNFMRQSSLSFEVVSSSGGGGAFSVTTTTSVSTTPARDERTRENAAHIKTDPFSFKMRSYFSAAGGRRQGDEQKKE